MTAVNLDRMAAHYATFLGMPACKFRSIVSIAAIGAICALIAVPRLHGQYSRPRLSPHETSRAVVEGARISVTYGRPSVRGRKIFGSLVPYDRVWMPGADEATIFQTSAPLQFGEFKLPAGSYSLYTLPGANKWMLIINKMTGQFHTVYPEDQDLAKLPMTIERLTTPVEQLTIEAVPHAQGGALQLEWELTRVSAPFTVLR
jgi:hypothetical protein